MSGKLPFLARYCVKRRDDGALIGYYSDQESLHIKLVNGKRIPLILVNEPLLETKTITEVRRERED